MKQTVNPAYYRLIAADRIGPGTRALAVERKDCRFVSPEAGRKAAAIPRTLPEPASLTCVDPNVQVGNIALGGGAAGGGKSTKGAIHCFKENRFFEVAETKAAKILKNYLQSYCCADLSS